MEKEEEDIGPTKAAPWDLTFFIRGIFAVSSIMVSLFPICSNFLYLWTVKKSDIDLYRIVLEMKIQENIYLMGWIALFTAYIMYCTYVSGHANYAKRYLNILAKNWKR